jgi:hypothetical protein
MSKVKKIPQPIYLTPKQKEFVRKRADKDGVTMNAFIVELIKAEMAR